jgi:hypothetical protein
VQRGEKAALLAELRDRGVFLIDLSEDPIGRRELSSFVPKLVERCTQLAPQRIILIKAAVFDATYTALRAAGLPVVPVRVPFPGSGQQQRFLAAFGRALLAEP